ncbi:hypothetical protein JCM19045_2972 [Bacillus sp. JCM 19045]|nr:hypothetical protein JCM19045_2972 [Bacillus sp. JCM 19045]
MTGDEESPVIVFFKNEGSKLELFPIEELAKDINLTTRLHSQQGASRDLRSRTMANRKPKSMQFLNG